MSTQKMSYFSDIDLATLHRSRLNERIQYKLSWFNRRQKYCIPAASKSVCKRDNATTAATESQKIKSYANNNHTFNTKASSMSGSDLAKDSPTATNRQRKNGHTNNSCGRRKIAQSPLNDSADRLSHSDESTTIANEIVYLKHNEPTILNRTHAMNQFGVNNNSRFAKRCARTCDEIETRPSSNQSTDRVTLNDPSVDPSKQASSVGSAAVNRTTQIHDVMSNKRSATPMAGANNVNQPVTVDQIAAIEEEDLELPHRKRSGTWP